MRRGHGSWAAAMLAVFVAACASGAPPVAVPSAIGTPVPTPELANGPERIVAPATVGRPPQPSIVAAPRADLVSDHCVDRDLPAPPVTDPAMVVLDRSYALPAAYVPDDLVASSTAGVVGVAGAELVRAAVVDDLADMATAWDAAGLIITLESGYRSYASQAATFDSWVARLGYADALSRAARPGHSEHQLGTALDLTSPGWSGRFGDWAVESPEGAWMAAHGWEFGFVMSYPAGSQDATCFSYEPWHYRWIGRDAAAAQRDSGLDLRRFLERYVGT
jgi:D-alanyl-D-alanine carboxypeptidase